MAAPNTFSLYSSWLKLPASTPQASVARGEAIFNGRSFIISNVAGLNDLAGTNVFPGTCATCHSNTNAGNDFRPQRNWMRVLAAVLSASWRPIFLCF